MTEYVAGSTVELVQHNASDDMVCMAAWVSFDKDKEDRLKDEKAKAGLIKFLYNNKHMSPFEHGQFTFKVTTPLFVRSEHHRHRTQSYNEVSGRYTKYDLRFYLPPRDRPMVQEGKPGQYRFVEGTDDQWAKYDRRLQDFVREGCRLYNDTLDDGIAKELARVFLPVNLLTSYYATVNPRNLMAFLDLRTDPTALHEIRDVADQMEVIFKEAMPLTYKAWKGDH